MGMTALAVFLLVRGLRGRWVGGEPRCRRCNYQLTGVESGRCPECGLQFTEHTVARGVRKRRWGSLAALVLIPLLWVPSQRLLWSLRYVRWYDYYPTRLVIRDARADELDAIRELERRLSTGALGGSHLDRVIQLTFDRLKNQPRAVSGPAWSRLGALLDSQDLFTEKQKDALFSQFVEVTLDVRPIIRQGEFFVAELSYLFVPFALEDYVFWHEPVEIRVAGQAIFTSDGTGWRRRNPDQSWCWFRDPTYNASVVKRVEQTPAGHYIVKYTGKHVFMAPGRNRSTDDPTWSKEFQLSAEVDILPADAPDPVKWIDDPAIGREVVEELQVEIARFGRTTRTGSALQLIPMVREGDALILESFVEAEDLPVTLALEVLADDGANVLRGDSQVVDTMSGRDRELVCRLGEQVSLWVRTKFPEFDMSKFFIIFRTNEEAAPI